MSKYEVYADAIDCGLEKLRKYYHKFNEKDVYILALILHPYYKLAYIEMAWGGREEQKREQAASNPQARDWCDEALQVVEATVEYYWEDHTKPNQPQFKDDEDDEASVTSRSLESDYDRCRRHLLQQSIHANNGGWKEELRHYLNDIPLDINKDLDIISWWAVHTKEYPTLARIAKDVCAIPATSVPCERLFSAGAEIAVDCRSRLGTEKFEHLQILKHAWRDNIVDAAGLNTSSIEEVNLEVFKQLLDQDKEMENWDAVDEVVEL